MFTTYTNQKSSNLKKLKNINPNNYRFVAIRPFTRSQFKSFTNKLFYGIVVYNRPIITPL